jgi:hypothetical protein
MRKVWKVTSMIIAAAALAYFPGSVQAHGFVPDGHDGKLRPIDYIELIGVSIGSLGLILYSFDQWRKEKAKPKK